MTKKQTLPSFLRKPKISNITVWPTKDGINNLDDNKVGKQLFLQMNEAAVDKAYGNKITKDGKCGMWFMPFRNIYWARAVLGRFGKVKADLAKKLVLATPRPKSIRLTAEQFRRQEMKNKSYRALGRQLKKREMLKSEKISKKLSRFFARIGHVSLNHFSRILCST